MEQTNVIRLKCHVKNLKRELVDMDDSRMEYSSYARFFDVESPMWHPYYDSGQRLMWLAATQSYFNAKLKAVGRVFLNEVYDALGIPKSEAGSRVGWLYKELNPIGDNYIDFDIYNSYNRDFINGVKVYKILLDFNVDGCIGYQEKG
jgi:hypothetical protein